MQDRVRAEAMDTENGRLRLERSASAWETRADELDAVAETRSTSRAEAIEEWNADETDEDET